MLLTVHALTGSLIALAVKDPALAAPLAFTSHFVLDSTPHFGLSHLTQLEDFNKPEGFLVGSIDLLCAFSAWLILLHFFPANWLLVSVGVFFACLPDLMYLPFIFFRITLSKKIFYFHSRIQWSQTPMGTITDASWAVAVIYMLARYK